MMAISELVSSEALRRYDDNGDPVYSPIERLLLALRWFDWASSERIFESLDLDTADLKGRDKYRQALCRLVARQRVERRETFGLLEYRLARVQPRIAERTESIWRLSREERERLGLCLRCDNDPVPGKKQCQLHLDKQKAANVKRRSAA